MDHDSFSGVFGKTINRGKTKKPETQKIICASGKPTLQSVTMGGIQTISLTLCKRILWLTLSKALKTADQFALSTFPPLPPLPLLSCPVLPVCCSPRLRRIVCLAESRSWSSVFKAGLQTSDRLGRTPTQPVF